MYKLSIVFGYRERDLIRVKRCLDSLQNQTFQDFEVLFVDYGTTKEVAHQVEALVSGYPFCRYIYNDTRGMPWNRSHALNTGIRLAEGEYLLLSDVDLIFSDNFLEQIFRSKDPRKIIHSQFYLLPQAFEDWKELKRCNNEFPLSASSAKGGIFFVRTELLWQIHGFDEYYCFWGVEDRDLSDRLGKMEVTTQWLDPKQTPVYHQWHPIVSNVKKSFMPPLWWDQMSIYYVLHKNELKRNGQAWGEIFTEKERPTLKMHQPDDFTKYIEAPKEGTSYVKSQFLTQLIEEIQSLHTDKSLLLTVPINKNRNFSSKEKIFRVVIHKMLKKFNLPFKLIDVYEARALEKEKYFIPEEDVFFTVWQLIKNTALIKDFSIDRNEQSIIYKLLKA